jgi:CBS domain-containing protein
MFEAVMGTLVTYNPRAVTPDQTLGQLETFMQELQVRHIPVVDDQHRVVGLVSERDLASVKYNAAKAATEGKNPSVKDQRVEKIMARTITTLEQFESPELALQTMVAHAFHSVPVTDRGRLVGMITSSDFLREFSYGDRPGCDETVRLRMSQPGHTVDAEAPQAKVLETAEQHNQEFVTIVQRHRPLGILSRTALRQSLYDAVTKQEMTDFQTVPVRLLLGTSSALPFDMPLGRAAGRMLECRARALPVVDRARLLLGVLQEDDLLRAMVEQLDAGQ